MIQSLQDLRELAAALHANAGTKAQSITLDLKNAPLKKVFVEIRRQGGLNFVYNNSLLKQAPPVDVHVTASPGVAATFGRGKTLRSRRR